MNVAGASVLLLGLLLGPLPGASPARGCEWDSSEGRGLDLESFRPHLGSPTDVADAEECKAACCSRRGCDAALVGAPQDGALRCHLVTCWLLGSDQCRLSNASQFQVHRRRRQLLGDPREETQARCRLPMKVGSCRAAFPRFFYDVTNQSCREFIYGGCEANANNFEAKEDCEATCRGVTGSVLPDESRSAHEKAPRMAPRLYQVMSAGDFAEQCGAEPEVGPCRAALPHWYFDSEAGSCKPFVYGGCRGNRNNYPSKQKCEDTCTGVTVLPASKKVGVADDLEEHCVAKPDAGPCRAAFPAFFYDPDTNSCQPFIYGGCRGNGNRYNSREECLSRCSVNGRVHFGRAGRRWTAGFFLFVTLAAISALLLAALIIFTLKRRAFTRQTSSISDKQELLPEAEDQLSVDSLSLPESPKGNQA
ncbi:unnamed protein product [Tetraodon nigroviridis]|uniref:(spotted green pufferfish) hypothetical protein n=1 Tax=Tetraodon nigroviridis TaxID=99883 RepID=Q4SB60_TETNG|nr:unnamed protein product [Tetraodon nigroviridis]